MTTATYQATYQVTGMTCGHCEAAVKDEVSQIQGVTGVEVSQATGILVVDAAATLDDAEVIAAVDEAGYAATRSSS